MPAPPMVSPSTIYSGPPPPYSYPSSAASSVVGGNIGSSAGQVPGSYVPPQGRQTSGEDKDGPYAAPRPALPSINEALSISSLITTNVPPRTSYTALSPTSPTQRNHALPAARPSTEVLPHPPTRDSRTFEAMNRPTMATYSPRPANNYNPNPSPVTNSYSAFPPSQPPRTIPSPPSYLRPAASIISQRHPLSPDENSLPPPQSKPPSSGSFGFQTYQPAYSFPTSLPAVTSYRPPVLQQSPWRSGNPDLERAEEVRKATSKDSPPNKPAYGESVKRHLDIFDLETSLNEVSGDRLRSPCR